MKYNTEQLRIFGSGVGGETEDGAVMGDGWENWGTEIRECARWGEKEGGDPIISSFMSSDTGHLSFGPIHTPTL